MIYKLLYVFLPLLGISIIHISTSNDNLLYKYLITFVYYQVAFLFCIQLTP